MAGIHDRLELLQLRYAASFPAKHGELLRAWMALTAAYDQPPLQHALHALLHRLHGSAGSYGYLDIGRCAAQLDISIQDWLHAASAVRGAADEFFPSLQPGMTELLDQLERASGGIAALQLVAR